MAPIKRFLLILLLTAMWSPSFMFYKLAVQDLSPWAIVGLRVSLAAAILLVLLRIFKQPLPASGWFWWHATMMALLASILPVILFCYAEQSIQSSVAGIINGSTPMFTALLAHAFLPSDRLTKEKVLGIGLSFAGLLLLFVPNVIQGMASTAFGISCATLAAFSYAAAHVYAKKYVSGKPSLVAPTAQLVSSALLLMPVAWIDPSFKLMMPSWTALIAMSWLTLVGTVLAFVLYYRLMKYCDPTGISMVACFIPVGAMLLGYFFLGEVLPLSGFIAAVLILIGTMIVNEVLPLRTRQPLSS